MRLQQININKFRNLINIKYQPEKIVNFFIGNNAQGKTNFLEAIYLLSNSSSFRSANDDNLINYQEEAYYINAQYCFNERCLDSEVSYNKKNGKKIFKVNRKTTNYKNDDRLRIVLFTPDDLFLVKGTPSKRRFFIDFILKQLSREYSYNLENFKKILNKRNFFLKEGKANTNAFEVINGLFIENSVKLIIQRINLINLMDKLLQDIYPSLVSINTPIKIKYALSFSINCEKINIAILKDEMRRHIENNIKQEINRRKTLIGPHLDDINFYINNRSAKIFASQGQQRNIAISVKLAEVYVCKQVKGYYPIFLLDEVMAELDHLRKQSLFNLLVEADFQSFITSVSLDQIETASTKLHVFENGELRTKGL